MADWRHMTDLEKRAALALEPGRITYIPGSPPKRFARSLASQAQRPQPEITDKQAAVLWSQIYRYRLQVKDDQLIAHSTAFLKESGGDWSGGD